MQHSVLFTTIALGGLALPARAQVLQPWGTSSDRSVSLDLLRPSFEGGGTSALTTVNQVGLRWPAGPIALVVEAPFVIAKADGASSGALLVGNPFLGLAAPASSSFIGELGVRPPVVSASSVERAFASEVAVFGDYNDFDAYVEDILTIRGTAGYQYRSPQHLAVRFAFRPALMVPTGDATGDSELFLDYGIQGGYETERASFGLAFNGRAIITEPDLSFGERTVHELGLGGSMTFGRLRPGATIRVPMDKDLSDVLNYSLGLRLEVTF